MSNLDLSKQRIKNAMKDAAGEGRRSYKVRETLQQTFSGLQTLLGLMQQGKTEQIRARKRAQKRRLLTILMILIIIAVVILTISFLG